MPACSGADMHIYGNPTKGRVQRCIDCTLARHHSNGFGPTSLYLGFKNAASRQDDPTCVIRGIFRTPWVWLFLDERIPLQTLVGGSAILLAIIWNVAGKNSQTDLASLRYGLRLFDERH